MIQSRLGRMTDPDSEPILEEQAGELFDPEKKVEEDEPPKKRGKGARIPEDPSVEEEDKEQKSTVGSTKACKELQGQKKQSRTHTRYCKGCKQYYRPEGMATKSAFCHRDKLRLDTLARLAKAQGKSRWFADCRKDEEKVHKMLKKYTEYMPEQNGAKVKASI